MFYPEVQVPVNLVAETQPLRKKCSKVMGTAGVAVGPRKFRLLKQIAKQKKKSASTIGHVDAPVPPVPDAPTAAASPAAALPDGAAAPPALAPPPVKDIPGPAPPSQSEVCFTLPMAHIQVLITSRRPAALPVVGARLPKNSSVIHRPTCYPRKRYFMTRIQVSNN